MECRNFRQRTVPLLTDAANGQVSHNRSVGFPSAPRRTAENISAIARNMGHTEIGRQYWQIGCQFHFCQIILILAFATAGLAPMGRGEFASEIASSCNTQIEMLPDPLLVISA
jgi:hypothetical protein